MWKEARFMLHREKTTQSRLLQKSRGGLLRIIFSRTMIIVALLLVNFYTFIQLSFLWLVLYFAAAAYFNSRVLKKVFDPLKEQASEPAQ